MKILIIIGLMVIGTVAYVILQKPAEKREGEITVGDIIEVSKKRLAGTATAEDEKKMLGISETPAAYEGTHLVSVSENDQALIRKGSTEVSFKIYVPSKIPKGFSLEPESIGGGVQYGAPIFQVVFVHKNGDKVYVIEHPLNEYLASGGMTLAEYTKGSAEVNVAGKKAYISYTTVTTARKYQYHQTITVIDDVILVRIEYSGEEKLSTADLIALAASLVR